MTTTEPEATVPEGEQGTPLKDVGPQPEAGDPGTPEHQAVLAVLREAGVQSNADSADSLATRLIDAMRHNAPAEEEEETEPEAEE